MSKNGLASIAAARVSGMKTRLSLSILATITAALLHPAWWPLLWFGSYLLAQMVDCHLFSAVLNSRTIKAPRERMMLASIVVNVVIFSSLAVYNWCVGGLEGKVFGAITICCSLMSVTVTMYSDKRFLFAALIPHAFYLMSLPILGLVLKHDGNAMPWMIVTVSIVTFLLYLLVAVRKLHESMMALKIARDEAHGARKLAEDANAAKSNFLAVITHEIRTPMNAVVSAVNLLGRTELNDDQKALLSMMGQASEMLLGLLNDVLDLSKIEAGKLEIQPANVDIAETLRNLEQMFRPQTIAKGLDLKISVDPKVASCIRADPLRLRQILFNLLSNAVKFTDHGAITLIVSRMDTAGAETRLLFALEDQGIGIPSDQLERIFSSFEQAEISATRRYAGTGLGLAISQKLAHLMAGEITVESVQGKGSCFTVSLPYEPVKAVAAKKIPERKYGAFDKVNRHVLIVDDHEVNRRIVSLLIESDGWRWTMAANGQEAVDLCHSQAFDIILMDMQMPVMDGLEATLCIRRERGPNRDTPIIALTANAMDHHRRMWTEIGVEEFLSKPIDPALLISTLRGAVTSRSHSEWQNLAPLI